MMLEKLKEVNEAYGRLGMTTDLLISIVQRTGQTTEGFYSMVMLYEHQKMINDAKFAAGASDPYEAMDMLLQQINNMIATVQTQIDRLDK